jgi:hypothetical protein
MKDIEKYLRENAPEVPEEGQFLIETNARLSAVEGIKKTVDGERRRGRIALIITLISGLVIGCAATLLVMFYPIRPEQPDVSVIARSVESLRGYKEVLMGVVAFFALALGIVFGTRRQGVI